MKNIIVKIMSIVITILIFVPNVLASSEPSVWAKKEVDRAITEEIVTENVKKDYQAKITREQFCEMVVLTYERLTEKEAKIGSISFSDTSNSEILKAANLGIVTGFEDGTFRPNNLITREQLAAMLVRTIDKTVPYADTEIQSENVGFIDEEDISSWAKSYVAFAYVNDIMQGVGEFIIAPKQNTTCEQAILLLYRTFAKYKDGIQKCNPQVMVYNPQALIEQPLIIDLNQDGTPDTIQYDSVIKKGGEFDYMIINGKKIFFDAHRHGWIEKIYFTDVDKEDDFIDIVVLWGYKGLSAELFRYDGENLYESTDFFDVNSEYWGTDGDTYTTYRDQVVINTGDGKISFSAGTQTSEYPVSADNYIKVDLNEDDYQF